MSSTRLPRNIRKALRDKRRAEAHHAWKKQEPQFIKAVRNNLHVLLSTQEKHSDKHISLSSMLSSQILDTLGTQIFARKSVCIFTT
jgi:hypothetical protein